MKMCAQGELNVDVQAAKATCRCVGQREEVVLGANLAPIRGNPRGGNHAGPGTGYVNSWPATNRYAAPRKA